MQMAKLVSLTSYQEYPPDEMLRRAGVFYEDIQRRRSVRAFDGRPVPRELIELCLLAAGTAPSGANMQPWHFVVVSRLELKREIRQAAEKQEYQFYHGRAGTEWLGALSVLGTGHEKPFLEIAPYLIVVFAQSYGVRSDGSKVQHYYVKESVGIATGLLIAAIHNAGLVALPYTPSRPGFLNRILERPENERPFLILVVGYPADDVRVPEITRKSLDETTTFL